MQAVVSGGAPREGRTPAPQEPGAVGAPPAELPLPDLLSGRTGCQETNHTPELNCWAIPERWRVCCSQEAPLC